MPKQGKKYKAALAKVDLDKQYTPQEAVALAKETAYTKFDASVEVHMRTALDPQTPVIHPSLGDNLAFERNHDAGSVDAAFTDSDEVVEAEFIFGRHTGVTLEPRAVGLTKASACTETNRSAWTRRAFATRCCSGMK